MPLTMIFDSECVLCSRTVQFVLRHERDHTIRFVGASSSTGRAIAARYGLSAQDLDLTFVIIDGERALGRSDAALRLIRHMRAPWRWLRVLGIVPRPVRDALYSAIARRRYRLFGRLDGCFVPDTAVRDRFLDI